MYETGKKITKQKKIVNTLKYIMSIVRKRTLYIMFIKEGWIRYRKFGN